MSRGGSGPARARSSVESPCGGGPARRGPVVSQNIAFLLCFFSKCAFVAQGHGLQASRKYNEKTPGEEEKIIGGTEKERKSGWFRSGASRARRSRVRVSRVGVVFFFWKPSAGTPRNLDFLSRRNVCPCAWRWTLLQQGHRERPNCAALQ